MNRVAVWEDGNCLEMDESDSGIMCHLIPWNCTFVNG